MIRMLIVAFVLFLTFVGGCQAAAPAREHHDYRYYHPVAQRVSCVRARIGCEVHEVVGALTQPLATLHCHRPLLRRACR